MSDSRPTTSIALGSPEKDLGLWSFSLKFFCLREEIQLCPSFKKNPLSVLHLVSSLATRYCRSAESDPSLISAEELF